MSVRQVRRTGSSEAGVRTIKKASNPFELEAFKRCPGNVLISHTVSHAVPSALEGLTAEFGMESGVSPLL